MVAVGFWGIVYCGFRNKELLRAETNATLKIDVFCGKPAAADRLPDDHHRTCVYKLPHNAGLPKPRKIGKKL